MKIILAALSLSVAVLAAGAARADEGFNVTAKAAVVMDADTGKVLVSRNPELRLPPASTTKVMTAVVALDRARLDDVFKVSKNASLRSPSKVYLRPGDEVTVEALLYSVLLKSANDSATALAEGIAGSELGFARVMTEKARALGAVNTNFVNASGLPADDHYSTAYDLALILRHAMRDGRFMRISSTRFATLNMGEKEKMLLKNHNKLLWYYDGAGAGKTGYTVAARHCFVGEASCSNTRLIVAVLKSHDLWGDTKRLLDKGFELAMTGQTIALADIEEPVIKKAAYKAKKKVSRKRPHRKKKRRRTY